jgi:hypothetical protein
LKASQSVKRQLDERQSHHHLGVPGIFLTEHNELAWLRCGFP